MKRWIIWIAVLLAVAAVLYQAFRPQPVTVETTPVRQGLFERTVDEDGLVQVRSRYLVGSPTAGTADRIMLRVGDTVKPGDAIAYIRPLPPALQDTRLVSELREAAGAARAGEMRARAQVARTRAAVQNARAEYQRAIELANQGFTARSTADTARSLLVQQQHALRAAEFDYVAARHQTQMALATLQRSGAPHASDTANTTDATSGSAGVQTSTAAVSVTSPVNGRILKVLHESAGPVSPGTGLVEIGDVEQLEAVIDVLSEDASVLRLAMPVRLKAGRRADTLFGQVSRIEPVAHTDVSTLGVEEQRVNVIVEFSRGEGDDVLGDGYRVDANIVVQSVRDALLVPIGAVIRTEDGWQVFVDDNGVATARAVSVNGRNNNLAWIEEGVSVGESVIVYPPDALRAGDRVRTGV
jgi:HlyD family secretion protein